MGAKSNKHLTHLEERILTDGPQGGQDAIDLLYLMGQFLSGKPTAGIKVTTKWDGAPSVICGREPETGDFFVGTKSVFAKDRKICKTQEDIQRMYSGVLANKLSACLKMLPPVVKNDILQGDLMFTDDKKIETINKKRFITFRPNTITYAADPKSPLGRSIDQAKLGIVFHTKYEGNTLTEALNNASFNVNSSDFSSTSQVWAEKAEFVDIGGAASMSGSEKAQYEKLIRRAEGSLLKATPMLKKLQSGKKPLEFDTEFLKFFNGYVKKGQAVPSVEKAFNEFAYHLGGEYGKQIEKNKTLQAQADKASKFITAVDFMLDNKDAFKMVIACYMNLEAAKMVIVDKLKRVSSLNLFVDMGSGGYKATTPEGFVGISGDKATKLVDRLEFSKLNFTVPKNWDK